MVTLAPGLDVEGPVQAEVFVLRLGPASPELAGPCGAQPWYLEVGDDEDPMVVVAEATHRVVAAPYVVHSTSWRRDRGAVVLSFVVVVAPEHGGEVSRPLARTDLARGGATSAPSEIETAQVVEHGLRHLSWLVQDDPVVAAALPGAWREQLDRYPPEPFRHLSSRAGGPTPRG